MCLLFLNFNPFLGFWALGVPLLVGPWGLGLGLGLGLGSGYGFSIPMDCTGGPLQDALVLLIPVNVLIILFKETMSCQ